MLSSGVLPPVLPASSVASEATVSVCFAPEEDCDAFAVRMIDGAEREILVSAYRLTVGSGVVRALIRATAGRGGSAGLDRRPGADGSRQDNGHRRGHPPRLLQLEPRRIRRISTSSPPRPSRQPMGRIGGSASPSQRLRRARGLVSGFVGRSALMRGRRPASRPLRAVSPSAELLVDPDTGAHCALRDSRAPSAEHYLWTVFGCHQLAARRSGELADARSQAEAAMEGYVAAWRKMPRDGSGDYGLTNRRCVASGRSRRARLSRAVDGG
jgi:hypothetical protein